MTDLGLPWQGGPLQRSAGQCWPGHGWPAAAPEPEYAPLQPQMQPYSVLVPLPAAPQAEMSVAGMFAKQTHHCVV